MATLRSPSSVALTLAACLTFTMTGALPAHAVPTKTPALVVTNDPLPQDLQDRLYTGAGKAPDITTERVLGDDYYQGGETVVGRKVDSLHNELTSLQSKISALSKTLVGLESSGQAKSAEYYANVATINTQLQSGTTPGNPRLIKKLSVARNSLEALTSNVTQLNDLSLEISNAASMASFLLESVRATFSLSGGVEEDHAHLAQLEDQINDASVLIDRMQNNVNDDISRTVSYLSAERNNLRTMSLAITTGDLFGKSLSNRPFSGAQQANFSADGSGGMAPQSGGVGSPRPLVKIRFDKPNVAYEQPVYMAVNEALQRYPNARFEVVAVQPSGGNAAQNSIESTKARRNAEKVLRSLTQMGLTMDRIDLSYMPSPDATTSEVHLYVR